MMIYNVCSLYRAFYGVIVAASIAETIVATLSATYALINFVVAAIVRNSPVVNINRA